MTRAERREDRPEASTIELVGGALCLDLANTVEGREGDELCDHIQGPGDLIVWARRAGALSDAEAGALQAIVASRPERLLAPLDRVMAAREAIYRVFTSIARKATPDPADVEALQYGFVEGMGRATLGQDAADPRGGFAWQWEPGEEPAFDLIRWRASLSAIELLRHGRLDRLRQCPGGGDGPCNWLFIDTTRGGNRRWCSMSDCGGRAKWRRQNARRRELRA